VCYSLLFPNIYTTRFCEEIHINKTLLPKGTRFTLYCVQMAQRRCVCSSNCPLLPTATATARCTTPSPQTGCSLCPAPLRQPPDRHCVHAAHRKQRTHVNVRSSMQIFSVAQLRCQDYMKALRISGHLLTDVLRRFLGCKFA
jgi:hypothetical protein